MRFAAALALLLAGCGPDAREKCEQTGMAYVDDLSPENMQRKPKHRTKVCIGRTLWSPERIRELTELLNRRP